MAKKASSLDKNENRASSTLTHAMVNQDNFIKVEADQNQDHKQVNSAEDDYNQFLQKKSRMADSSSNNSEEM